MEQIETDGSANLEVSRGTRIHLVMPVPDASGLLWTLTECGQGLMVEREPGTIRQQPDGNGAAKRTVPRHLDASPRADQATATHVASLRAITAGYWSVELQLSRAWENRTAQVRRFTVTVI